MAPCLQVICQCQTATQSLCRRRYHTVLSQFPYALSTLRATHLPAPITCIAQASLTRCTDTAARDQSKADWQMDMCMSDPVLPQLRQHINRHRHAWRSNLLVAPTLLLLPLHNLSKNCFKLFNTQAVGSEMAPDFIFFIP